MCRGVASHAPFCTLFQPIRASCAHRKRQNVQAATLYFRRSSARESPAHIACENSTWRRLARVRNSFNMEDRSMQQNSKQAATSEQTSSTAKDCDGGETVAKLISSVIEVGAEQEEVEVAEVEVAIVGGGLGGLALLVALHTRGIKAHLYEKYPGLRSDTATAIGIGPNGITALEGIQKGLSRTIAELGTYTKVAKVDITVNDHEVSSNTREWPDATYICVNWKLVQQALANLVSKDYIHCCHELLSYKQVEDGHVNASFDVKEENESSNFVRSHTKVIHTQMLVGADGIWSSVRKQMVNDEPRYLHMVDWNALVYDPNNKIIEDVGRGEIYFHTDLKLSMSYFLVNAGDYALWILRTLDDNGELGKTLLRTQGSFGDPKSKIRALQQIPCLTRWDSLRKAIEKTDEKCIFERKIMDRLPIDKWSDADSRVLLIGDAAHAQYVGPGQGARTAFEDAHQLAILLEEAKLSGFCKDSIQRAVSKFEEVRIPRLRKMQEYAAYSTQQTRFQPDWMQKLSPEEKQKMAMEYRKWVDAYPSKQQGDPESTYFK